MAYGYSRGSRGYEPDPRDVIEDAARDAGMSVQQWLDRAVGADNDYGRRGSRRRSGRDQFDESPLEAAARRIERRASRDQDLYSDGRADHILHSALETIRANEERTASALEILERRIDGRMGESDRPLDNRVLGLIDSIERGMGPRATSAAARASQSHPDPDLIEALEQKISNVVDMIEKRGSAAEPGTHDRQSGQRRDLRSRSGSSDAGPAGAASTTHLSRIERQLAAFGQRIDALSLQTAHRGQAGSMGQLNQMQQEIARLGGNAQAGHAPDVHAAIHALEHKLARFEQGPMAGKQFERLLAEISAMRAGLHQRDSAGSPDFSALERHFETLENRLEAITDKVMTMRVSGVRDLRGQKSVETAIDELKHLVQASRAPAEDSRVLGALQSLEQRLEAMERAPQELAARIDRFQTLEDKLDAIQQAPSEIARRLDHLQSLMAERPAALAPIPGNVEVLLGSIAARLESLQNGPSDDQAFERLHLDIQALSRKLEAVPAAQQGLGIADVSGLERSISDLFRQLDGIKSDIGTATEHAIHRAATDVLSKAPVQTGSTGNGADTAQVQRTLSDIHVAQQEAERRTTETLGAVHDTLQRVVDRLVDMERDMKRRDEMPAPVAAPQPTMAPTMSPMRPSMPLQPLAQHQPTKTHASPVQEDAFPDEFALAPKDIAHAPRTPSSMVEAPHAAPPPLVMEPPVASMPPLPSSGPGPMPLKPLMANPLPPLGAAEPRPASVEPIRHEPPLHTNAVQDTIASMRAQRMGVSAPVAMEEPASKSAFASAFAAAKGAVAGIKLGKGKPKAEAPTPDRDGDDPRSAAHVPSQSPSVSTLNDPLDLPLEPGSGRPGQDRLLKADSSASNDPKANFLAAARRAAQTAADQSADVLAETKARATDKSFAASGKTALSKKHALLLGLAALIVAVGATVQFTRDPEPAVQPKVEAPARKSTVLERAVDRLAQANTTPRETTPPVVQPRQILPATSDPLPAQLSAAKPDDRVLSQPPRQAQGQAAFLPSDPATVGSLGPEAGRTTQMTAPPGKPGTTATADPLFRFEGIRDAERLKEAARAGDASAFIELGTRYLEGKGAPRDPKAAALWFERAADFGSAPAQYRLGALYREGRGVERNTRMALKHFQTASDAGNARAMHNTAVLLAEGVNGSPEYAAASEWFKKAAEFGIRDSQYNLAILYARGLGVSQDLMASYAWFAAAAANGDEDAGKKRDEVGARLSGEKLQQAKAAATAWKPKTPDPAANEVTVPAGGWDAAVSAPAGNKPKPTRS